MSDIEGHVETWDGQRLHGWACAIPANERPLTVEIVDEEERTHRVTIVGNDEADAGVGRIGWDSPIARALRRAAVGDVRRIELPGGTREFEVIAIDYRA